MKIAVMGYAGSGKSTLAKKLAGHYGIPVLYLDAVQFLPGWALRDDTHGRAVVWAFMQNPSWVIDGNYSKYFKKERLEQADHAVFLNFNRVACLYRACRRYFKYRNKTRESMGEGCTEKMDWEFVCWILYKGRTKAERGHYRQLIGLYREKTVVLKNQRQVDAYCQKAGLPVGP